MDLTTQVTRNIAAHQLLPHIPILVAVSGGVDSMVLLDLMAKLGKKHRTLPLVAHLNHRLRGSQSDADERLVKNTARRLGLRVVTEKADVREFARRKTISLEMAARQLRHEFLARSAKKLRINTVALAHHGDDQVELFFLRLFRGGSVANLAGMDWRNQSPVDPKIFLVRPLLNVSKAMLENYAKLEGIECREDKSNRLLAVPRNRIRNELLPFLRKNYQPKLEEIVTRAMEILREENDFMENMAGQEIRKIGKKGQGKKTKPDFRKLPIALQRRCLLSQLERMGIKPEFEMIEFLRLHPGKQLSVQSESAAGGRNRSIQLGGDGSVKFTTPARGEFHAGTKTLAFKRPGGKTRFGAVQFEWQFKTVSKMGGPMQRKGEEWFDAKKVGSGVILRFWRPGDRFQPIGMDFAQKVQDLFTNRKIPMDQRRELVVAEAANSQIFWIEGLRIAERFKLTEATSQVLLWRWSRI